MALPLILGMAALGAGTAYLQGKQQERQNQANMLAQAAAAKYSPWTGITPQMGGASSPDVGGSALGGAMQGALGGYMASESMKETDLANQKNELEVQKLQEELGKKPMLYDQPMAASQLQKPQLGSSWLAMRR